MLWMHIPTFIHSVLSIYIYQYIEVTQYDTSTFINTNSLTNNNRFLGKTSLLKNFKTLKINEMTKYSITYNNYLYNNFSWFYPIQGLNVPIKEEPQQAHVQMALEFAVLVSIIFCLKGLERHVFPNSVQSRISWRQKP